MQRFLWKSWMLIGVLALGWIGGWMPHTTAHANSYQAALAETVEIQLNSAEIQPLRQKAAQLGTPLDIYRYVHDYYEYYLYFGSRSNAANTFHSEGANDVDLATLLIAMMRSQGVPARYVRGDVVIPKYNLSRMTRGFKHDVANMFATVEVDVSNGDQFVEIDRTWVQIFVPQNSITGVDPSINCVQSPHLCHWLDLDPSYKFPSSPKVHLFLLEKLNFDYTAYYHAQKNNDYSRINQNPVTVFEQQIREYLAAHHPGTTLRDVADQGTVQNSVCINGLPYNHPYSQVRNARYYNSVAAHDAAEGKDWGQYVRLSVEKAVWSGSTQSWNRVNVFQDFSVLRSEISTQPLRLEFESCGGNCVQSQVLVGDTVRFTNNSSQIQWGDRIFVKIKADITPSFEGLREYASGVVGGQYVIGLNDHTSNWAQVQRASHQLNAVKAQYKVKQDSHGEMYVDSNNNNHRESYEQDLSVSTTAKKAVTRAFLELITRMYFYQVENSTKRLEALGRVNHLLRTGMGAVGPVFRDGGALDVLKPGGLLIDMHFYMHPWFRPGTNANVEAKYRDLFGHMISYFEHQTLESLTGYDAISTMSGLQRAIGNGGELLVLYSTQGDSAMETAMNKMGFSSSAPGGILKSWDLFGSRPVTWEHRHHSGILQYDLIKKHVDYDTPHQRRISWRYINYQNTLMKSYANRLNTINVQLDRQRGSCFLSAPGIQIGNHWHAGDCNHVKNLLQADYYSTTNQDWYAFFDQVPNSYNGHRGFSRADYLFRSHPPRREDHSIGFALTVRDTIQVPLNINSGPGMPSNPRVKLTIASKRSLGRHYDASVYIRDVHDASTNGWSSFVYAITNQSFHAGGGHGIADKISRLPYPIVPPESGFEAEPIPNYAYPALDLQPGWNQISSSYLQAPHPPHALAGVTPENGTLVLAQVVNNQVKVWSSSDDLAALDEYSRMTYAPLDAIDTSRPLWIGLWGDSTPLPLSWLEPVDDISFLRTAPGLRTLNRAAPPPSCEPISFDNAPGLAPPPIGLNQASVLRVPQTLGNGAKRVTLMGGWNLVKNEFSVSLDPAQINSQLRSPTILGTYMWKRFGNQWKAWASSAPTSGVGAFPLLPSLSEGENFWVYLPKNYNNLSFTVDLADPPSYTTPPSGQSWDHLVRDPSVTGNGSIQASLQTGWNVVQNMLLGDLSIAELTTALQISAGGEHQFEIWQYQNDEWKAWNSADPSGQYLGGVPQLSSVSADSEIWIHVSDSAGGATLVLGQPADPTNVDRSVQPHAEAVTKTPLMLGPAGVGRGSHEVLTDGSFSYALPIEVIPGTNGVAPDLALVYNSGVGNGSVGIGWGVSGLPTITRMQYGDGIHYDDNDTFQGPEGRLVLYQDHQNGQVEYRNEYEDWKRYIRVGSGNNQYWIVYHPDGSKQLFGSLENAKVRANDRPNNPIRVWALNQYRDAFGNLYTVSYTHDQGAFYPDKISYTHGSGLNANREIRFSFEGRPDPITSYGQGTKVVTAKRLEWIEVMGNGTLVRKYFVKYKLSAVMQYSLVEAIVDSGKTGNDGVPHRYTFEWRDEALEGYSPDYINALYGAGDSNPFSSPIGNDSTGVWYFPADFDGDGKQDLLEAAGDGSNRVFFFDVGLQKFVKNDAWSASLENKTLQSNDSNYRRLHVGDFNGDGKADLLSTRNSDTTNYNNNFYFAETDGFVSAGSFSEPLQIGAHDRFMWVYVSDFNGDGKSDILRTGKISGSNTQETAIFYSHSSSDLSSFQQGCLGNKEFYHAYDGMRKTKHFPYLGDFNGDGKTDVMLSGIAGAANELWVFKEAHNYEPGCTNDFELAEVGAIASANAMHHHTNKVRALAGDFNGDGKADLLRTANFTDVSDDGPNQLWLANGTGFASNSLETRLQGHPLEYVLDGTYDHRLYSSDFNGDGRTDLLETRQESAGHSNIHFSKGDGSFASIQLKNFIPGELMKDGTGTHHLILGDFNGDGQTDILRLRNFKESKKSAEILRHLREIDDSSGNGQQHLWLSQLAPDNYQLVKIVTDMGGDINVTYHPSTDSETGTPIQPEALCHGENVPRPQCGNAMSFPRLLVTQVEEKRNRGNAALNSKTTRYTYENERLVPGDPKTGRYLGFEFMTETHVESKTQTKTQFWQGIEAYGRPHVVEISKHDYPIFRSETQYKRVFPHSSTEIKLVLPTQENSWEYEPEPSTDLSQVTNSSTVEFFYYDETPQGYYAPNRYIDCVNMVCTTTLTQYNHYAHLGLSNPLWILGRERDVRIFPGMVITGEGTDQDKLQWTQSFYDDSRSQYPLQWERSCKHPQGRCDQDPSQWVITQQNLSYDASGNLTQSTDRYGHPTTFEYDATYRTFLKEQRHYLGQSTSGSFLGQSYAYDAAGRVIRSTEANGYTVHTEYDDWGRITRIHKGDNAKVEYTYSNYRDVANQHNKMEVFGVGGELLDRREVYFDGFGFVYKETALGHQGMKALWNDEKWEAGLLTTTRSLPCYCTMSNQWTRTEYDLAGRVYLVFRPEDLPGQASEIYTYRGSYGETSKSRLSRTEGSSVTRHAEYFDPRGNLVRVEDDELNETIYEYDLLNRLTKVKLETNEETTIQYDGLGRRTHFSEPHMGSTSYIFDDSNHTQTISNNRGSITYTYDALDRVTQETSSDGQWTVTYVYDQAANQGDYTNSLGRLSSVSFPGGTYRYAYDTLGNVIRKTTQFTGSFDQPYVQNWGYDGLGRVEKTVLPEDSTLEYAYMTGGNLQSVKVNGLEQVQFPEYTRLDQVKVQRMWGRNNHWLETTYAYYGHHHRLQYLTTTQHGGGASVEIQKLEYLYNHYGKVTQLKDLRNNPWVGGVNTSREQTFEYDNMMRLDKAEGLYKQPGNDNDAFYLYDYDAIGNLTKMRRKALTYTPDLPKRLAQVTGQTYLGSNFGVTVDFDTVGNMTQKSGNGANWSLEYDQNNRLTRATDANNGVVVSFTYDHRGQRIKKVYQGANQEHVVTWYVGANFERRQDLNKQEDLVTTYVYGNGRKLSSSTRYRSRSTVRLQGDTKASLPIGTFFYHPDHLGSSTVISDDNGKVVTRIAYLPFGGIDYEHSVGLDSVTHKFTSQELDEETGFYYYNARYYDPEMGRFLTADSIVPDPRNGQAFNRYAYVLNSPLFYVDPTGHDPQAVFGASGSFISPVPGVTDSSLMSYGANASVTGSLTLDTDTTAAVTFSFTPLQGYGAYAGYGAVIGGGDVDPPKDGFSESYHAEFNIGLGKRALGLAFDGEKDKWTGTGALKNIPVPKFGYAWGLMFGVGKTKSYTFSFKLGRLGSFITGLFNLFDPEPPPPKPPKPTGSSSSSNGSSNIGIHAPPIDPSTGGACSRVKRVGRLAC